MTDIKTFFPARSRVSDIEIFPMIGVVVDSEKIYFVFFDKSCKLVLYPLCGFVNSKISKPR